MNVIATEIPEVLIVEPKIFADERGYFCESYNEQLFEDAIGSSIHFVQDNHSLSVRNVLRGLHYQIERPQAKLVRVISGEVFDVAVDIRRSSPTYGRWVGEILSVENKKQMWIPEGFAHGFLALSDKAELIYKASDYYYPEAERCIRWDDDAIAVRWPISGSPKLSEKDQAGDALPDADTFS